MMFDEGRCLWWSLDRPWLASTLHSNLLQFFWVLYSLMLWIQRWEIIDVWKVIIRPKGDQRWCALMILANVSQSPISAFSCYRTLLIGGTRLLSPMWTLKYREKVNLDHLSHSLFFYFNNKILFFYLLKLMYFIISSFFSFFSFLFIRDKILLLKSWKKQRKK